MQSPDRCKDQGRQTTIEGPWCVESAHVLDVSYLHLSHDLGVCYIEGCVIPSMQVPCKPYFVRMRLITWRGYTNTADCNCTAGLSGIYKHKDRVSWGMSKACSSVPQELHRSRKQFTASALLADVHISDKKTQHRICQVALGCYRPTTGKIQEAEISYRCQSHCTGQYKYWKCCYIAVCLIRHHASPYKRTRCLWSPWRLK